MTIRMFSYYNLYTSKDYLTVDGQRIFDLSTSILGLDNKVSCTKNRAINRQ